MSAAFLKAVEKSHKGQNFDEEEPSFEWSAQGSFQADSLLRDNPASTSIQFSRRYPDRSESTVLQDHAHYSIPISRPEFVLIQKQFA